MSSQVTDFASLYAAEHDRLRRLLMRRGASAAAAADIVHDAFVKMLRAPATDLSDPKRYLFRIAGNIAIDEYRSQCRRARIFDAETEATLSVADTSPEPDAILITAEQIAALHHALSELPPRSQEVLLLHKFEGLSYAEVSHRLGISKNTVKVHLAKAITILRNRLRENSSPTE